MFLRFVKRFIVILTSWFLIHQLIIVIDGLNDDEVDAKLVVVFGNKVHKDGTLSLRLKARLDKAIDLYNSFDIKTIFVSGGLGKEGYYEGDKMAEYLIFNGIPQSQITIDNKGLNTMLTVQNVIKQYPKLESVVVVTQFYHVTRAKLAFKKLGIERVCGTHCDFFETRDFYSLFREFFGYYKYLLSY